jgi:ammonium transporter, Amt family
VVAVVYGLFGYGLAFGDTTGEDFLYGFIGKDMFYFKKNDYDDGYGYNYASWLFHWSFAALTAFISISSMSERITFRASMLYTIFLVSVIYPPIACAIWNKQGFGSARRNTDRLFGCGVIDFAGSGVVHITGGVSALIGAVMIGPRRSFLMNEAEISDFGNIFQVTTTTTTKQFTTCII